MSEYRRAYKIAERLLDEPNADPDDDARTLARAYQRLMEAIGIATTRGFSRDEHRQWHQIVVSSIDPSAMCSRCGKYAPVGCLFARCPQAKKAYR